MGSHPEIEYTGEIFYRRIPHTDSELHSILRDAKRDALWTCVDVKYNQLSAPLARWMARDEVRVIQLVRRDTLAIYFSGALHTWRGEHPEQAAAGEVPPIRFDRSIYDEQVHEIGAYVERYAPLADLVLYYERLTGGSNVKAMPVEYSTAICDLLGVEHAPMSVDFDKDAPPCFLRHLAGVPLELAQQSARCYLEDL